MNGFSVIVLTYNPVWDSLKRTLESVLIQKDVCFEIIIADDGSGYNFENELVDFFCKKNFSSYKFSFKKNNEGTVRNIETAMTLVSYEYIKLISPGDFLYDSNTLSLAKSSIETSKNVSLYFGDCIPYSYDKTIEIQKHYIYPKEIKPYMSSNYNRIRFNYLFKNDFCIGAGFIVKSDFFLKYLKKISGIVKYAEDCSIICMIANKEKIHYLNQSLVWYEVGTGISTSYNSSFTQKVNIDIFNCYNFLYNEKYISCFNFNFVFSKKIFYKILRKLVFIFSAHDNKLRKYDISLLEKLIKVC